MGISTQTVSIHNWIRGRFCYHIEPHPVKGLQPPWGWGLVTRVFFFFLFVFLRQGSLGGSGWPITQRSSCFCHPTTGLIKIMHMTTPSLDRSCQQRTSTQNFLCSPEWYILCNICFIILNMGSSNKFSFCVLLFSLPIFRLKYKWL